jgi:integrase
VDANGNRRWECLFRWRGKTREMGLGSLATLTLAEAREAAGGVRKQARAGIDPIAARDKAREGEKRIPTFGEAANEYVKAHKAGWRNAKHAAQWEMTLGDAYCRSLRKLPVDQITTVDVLAVLKPVWQSRPETASRLRGRIERVLDAARVEGRRQGETPAAWRGHLQALLAKPQKLSRGHHRADPYATVPAIVARLRDGGGQGARALRLLILTAARAGEVVGARVDEFDVDGATWTVPAVRMKA